MTTFVDTVAPERFARYLSWADGDADVAHRLYAKNVALAEAFYTPLHVLEIVLRNRVDNAMLGGHGGLWFDDPAIVRPVPLQRKVQEARRMLASLGAGLTRGHIIAELSFGFWTGMFNRRQSHLWGTFRPMFVGAPRNLQRRNVSGQLDDIRGLRNRIAHHEPIVQLDLMAYYREIRLITEWLSPDAAAWLDAHSRFLAVCPPGRIVIGQLVDPALAGVL